MINATINDPAAKNQASNDPTKVGTGSVVANKSVQAPVTTPNSTATPSKAPIFNAPTTPPSPVTPTPVEFNKGVVGGNLNKPELKNTGVMGAPVNSNTPGNSNEKPSKPKKKKKFNVKMIAGVFVLLLLIVGASAGLFLSQQSQDLRQQAMVEEDAGSVYGTPDDDHDCPDNMRWTPDGCRRDSSDRLRCGPGTRAINGTCVPDGDDSIDTATVDPDYRPDVDANRYGAILSCPEGSDADCVNGAGATATEWEDLDVTISGTYVHCGALGCERYIIDLPATHEAATAFAVEHGAVMGDPVTSVADPDGIGTIDLRPRLLCADYGSGYNYGVCDLDTINFFDEDGNFISMLTGYIGEDGLFYLDLDSYNALVDSGQTWVSPSTGCNDGVHDYASDSDEGYLGDCVTWHWTTCLDEGSGVNGWGCGEEPPDNPPGEETPPPTLPPELGCNDSCSSQTQCSDMNSNWFCDPTSSKCRLKANPPSTSCDPVIIPGEPMCKDVAVLENGVEINPATASFSIGMVLQFRCAADDPDSQVTNFEFQVTEPDGTIINGAAINPAGTSATSLEYQIDQYLEHQVQCRVCTGDGCQEWISVVQ